MGTLARGAVDEAGIDLQFREWNGGQQLQVGAPGAVVVDRQAEPHHAQAQQALEEMRVGGQHRGFRNLERDVTGQDAMPLKACRHLVDELGMRQRTGVHIDRKRDRDALVVQGAAGGYRFFDHAPVEEVDAAHTFQYRNECRWPQHAMFGVAPAGEHFQSFDGAGFKLDLGLEVRVEFALLQAPPHFGKGEFRMRRAGFRLDGRPGIVGNQFLQPGRGDWLARTAQYIEPVGFSHRFDGKQDVGALRRKDNDARPAVDFSQAPDHFQSIHAGQGQVHHGDVGRRIEADFQQAQRAQAVGCRCDVLGAQVAQHANQ